MSSDLQILLQDDINDLITNQIIRLGLESEEHHQLMREIIDYHNHYLPSLPRELQVLHCGINTIVFPESWPQTEQVFSDIIDYHNHYLPSLPQELQVFNCGVNIL